MLLLEMRQIDMTTGNDEYKLAPIEEEVELSLALLEDEDEKRIAPDFPLDTKLRLIPVICSACKTRLYATEDQVGMWKVCPDCGRKNEIRYVEPAFQYTVEISEHGGYVVKEPEIEQKPTFNIGADYRTVGGEREQDFIPLGSFNDEQPIGESILQNMLRSKAEKEQLRKNKEFEERIEREARAAKQMKERMGIGHGDPVARRIAEKENAAKMRMERVDDKSPKKTDSVSVPVPPLRRSVGVDDVGSVSVDFADDEIERIPFFPGVKKFFQPFTAVANRRKLVVLFVIGFVANLSLEKTKAILGQVFLELHNEQAGQILSLGEMGLFTVSFFLGTFLGIIWAVLILIFGFSIYSETSKGRIRVDQWILFDLGLGASYVFWTGLTLFVSFYPGVFFLWGLNACVPSFDATDSLAAYYVRIGVLGTSAFIMFPVLLLCITETETFFGGFPRKTFTSLVCKPLLWFNFYATSLVFAVSPFLLVFGVAYVNLEYHENSFTQSPFYYIVVALLDAVVLGFFPLIYFRLLGRAAYVIQE